MTEGPLAGVRIVEIATYVAAPLAGLTCAQLGAEVIRIDPPGGAPDTLRLPRANSGASLYWTGLNKGKRSVVLDLRAREGVSALHRLLAHSGPAGGIVVTNAPPRAGVDAASLIQVRPDLVHVQVTGTRTGDPAVDYTVNAATGFADVTGPAGFGGRVNHVLPAWDIACGLHAALAVLAALRHRDRTGEGQQVQVALLDVAVAMASHLGFLAEAELGISRERSGNDVFGTYGTDFVTRDGAIMLLILTPRHWRELLDRTGLGPALDGLESALGTDFSDEARRYEHRAVITALLQPWFRMRSRADVAEAFAGVAFPWSPFRTFGEVVADPATEMDQIVQPGVGVIRAARSALRMSRTAPGPARPAPELGADTDAVLAELAGSHHGAVKSATMPVWSAPLDERA